jgi:hypothetical protein
MPFRLRRDAHDTHLEEDLAFAAAAWQVERVEQYLAAAKLAVHGRLVLGLRPFGQRQGQNPS